MDFIQPILLSGKALYPPRHIPSGNTIFYKTPAGRDKFLPPGKTIFGQFYSIIVPPRNKPHSILYGNCFRIQMQFFSVSAFLQHQQPNASAKLPPVS
jgi:hypothetical protein